MTDTPPSLALKRRIRRFSPVQTGKVLAMLYGIIGLIFVPFFVMMTLFAPPMPEEHRTGMMAMGFGFAVFAPLAYAAGGFVFGVLGAALYNRIAKWVGGIEVELE